MIAAEQNIVGEVRFGVRRDYAAGTDDAVGSRVEDAVERRQTRARVVSGILANMSEESCGIDIPAIGVDQDMVLRNLGRVRRIENTDLGDGAAGQDCPS